MQRVKLILCHGVDLPHLRVFHVGREYVASQLVRAAAEVDAVLLVEHLDVPGARVLEVATEKVGRWDGDLSLALMKAAGVDDAEVSVEETSRDLRLVRKYAIGLRQNVERCVEAVGILNAVVLGARDAASRGRPVQRRGTS